MSAIDDYLMKLDQDDAKALGHIRELIHDVLPDAEESWGYGMPAFRYKGKYLMGLNSFKDHLSLFPTSYPVEALQDKLGDFKTSRGTIQFTAQKPIPDDLIREIINSRLSQF